LSQNKYLKTEIPGLVKDPVSGALLYTDNTALATYKRERARNVMIDKTTERVMRLESDVSEIKDMLKKLLEK